MCDVKNKQGLTQHIIYFWEEMKNSVAIGDMNELIAFQIMTSYT